ncbi:DUF2634 domain-containing protein [Paenibacillus sp. FSL H8-0034]|uniref:DUF2634 domain-containing protein n=1 Tax=Paenibacillus sp. FSL H8-0034 TaxID=2954671 RepID=UPI0030F7F182
MIPQGSSLDNNPNIKTTQQPSRTYKIDPVTKRIVGMIDGIDAVKQAVWKILQVERFEHVIYQKGNHGINTTGIVGSDPATAQSRLTKAIRDALLYDDRITDVTDFSMTFNGDEALATFTVVTQFGNFQSTKTLTGI